MKLQDITDNKKSWKTIRPYFSDKGYNQTKIAIVEKDSIVTDEEKIATLMNNYFINITKNLDLKPSTISSTSDMDKITKHFDDHISVCKIKEAYSERLQEDNFCFKMVSMDEVEKIVLKLNSKKSSTHGAIPGSILKQTIEVHLKYLTKTINHSLKESTFPDELKQSEVIPVYKKLDPLQKENYRPVSLLPHISKVFERVIYKQINNFMENKISKCVTGFRKSHGTQHSLIAMLEKWKKALDKEENISAIFMDLSKAFYTINHDLLAKLKTYGFANQALSFMWSYLKNRRQRVQINNKFSSLKEVIAGIPQGSIDGPLLFNLFINDLFLFICFSTLSNYADDDNLFTTGTDIQLINQMLLSDFRTVNIWFYENFMNLNLGKCHFMSIVKDAYDEDVFYYDNLTLKNSNEEVILGVTIDIKLTFHQHIKKMCRKDGQKLSALLRLSPYLDTNKRKTIYTIMVKSQLNYCPLVWMFCPRRSNNLINIVQERALRITYNDQQTDFKSLLSNHNEIIIHQRNLQVLMTEIYKIINDIAPPIVSSLFEIRENTHNTRYFQVLSNESRRTVNYGIEIICHRAPFLWANLRPEYKLANSLNIFKRKIKNWKGENWPCTGWPFP